MRFLPSNRQRPHAFLHRVSAYCTLRGYTAQSDNFPAAGVADGKKTKGRDMKYLDYFERIQHGTVSYPIAYYHVTHDHPRYEMIHHWHIEHELIVVESGFLNVNLDGTDYRLGAGDACFISDGVVHSAKPEHAVYDSIVFDMRALLTRNQAGNKAISDIISHHRVVTPILPSGDEKILSLAASIREASENGANGFELVVQGAILQLIGIITMRHLYGGERIADKRSTGQLEPFKRVIGYIEENYASRIMLADLAKTAGMTPKYFCSFFYSMTRKTPIEYVNSYRIERACEQLITSDTSITDIGLNCGFNEISYFIKTFRRHVGTTPHQYRKKMRSAD